MRLLPVVVHPGSEDRFWAKVEKTPDCWRWTANVDKDGYGKFWDGQNQVRASRFSYVLHKGPIPDGLTIDHLCLNRGCVNPEHLEAVEWGVNVLRGGNLAAVNARKTHCMNGHPFDEENTYQRSNGWRTCRICNNALNARSNLARKARA